MSNGSNGETAAETTVKKRPRALKILLWTAALAAATAFALPFGAAWALKTTVNNFGADFLGVDECRVKSIVLNPFGCRVSLKGLIVGKPAGGKYSHNLLEAENIVFDLSAGTVFSDTVLIEELTVEGFSLTCEKPLAAETNIDAVIEKLAGTESAETEEAPDKTEKPGEIFLAADKINIDGAKFRMIAGGVPVPLPPVTLKLENVGKKQKLTPVKFGVRLLMNFLNVFNRADLGEISKIAGTAGDAAMDAAGTGIEFAENAAGTLLDGAGTAVESAGNLGNAVLDFFGNESGEKTDKK